MDKVFKSTTIPLVVLVLTVFLAGPAEVQACIPGDLDENCLVDLKDLMVFTEQWLDTGGCSDPNCADLDDDSNVDMADFAMFADNYRRDINPVVINEIHTDPDVKTEQVEFVELYNISNETVDLSGWYFSRGFDFTFPPSTSIPPHGYIVVVENTNVFDPNSISSGDFQAKFGFEPNGVFIGKLNNNGENIELRNADGEEMDQVDYQLGFPWPTVGESVPFADPPDGSGHSMQLANPCLDNDLGGSWRSGSPTPGAKNTPVYSDNIPPQIRQVNHDPEEPTSSDAVNITCKVTDPEGVNSVTLHWQLVSPGSYIRLTDGAYSSTWTNVTMYDNGTGADEIAGDDVYTAQLSSSANRSLVRYRITVEDNDACSVTVPYSDDPVPNFAYFVYDGIPAWSGARNPSGSPPDNVVVTYGTDVMTSLPVYHLLAVEQDVLDSQHIGSYSEPAYWGSDYPWYGTLVYDGEVYDHVSYRARGGGHRYDSGKNMWKFDFKRGHYFRARDDYGRWYDTSRDKLNLSSTIQNPDYEIRGKEGMFEGIGYKLFNLVGVPGPKTHWIHFRIIDDSSEYVDQYDGDFWGLYLIVEQMDGRFLDEHDLLDGNLYKMDTDAPGDRERNNQGPTAVDDYSDVDSFVTTYKTSPSTSWWTTNVDVNSYFSYRTVVEGMHHYDIGAGKNYFYYLDPVTAIWEMLPWDLDLIFDDDAWDCFNNGDSPFKKYGLWGDSSLEIDRNNRIREILDLLFNYEQENQLIDEYAVIIGEPNAGGLSFVDADVALWDYHPYINDPGHFFQTVKYTGDFDGVIDRMKNFIRHRVVEGDPNEGTKEPGLSEICDDSAIPDTPVITFVGNPNYPTNNLRFQTSAFSGSGSFAAVKWRIGQVEESSQIPGAVELDLVSNGSSWKYYKGETSAPPGQGPGGKIDWQEFSYSDSAWFSGPAPLGWGEDPCFLGTELTGMQYAHSSFYLRQKFTVDDLAAMDSVRLKAMYDDGFNVWINENWLVSKNMSGESVPYNGYATAANPDEKDWFTFSLPNPSSFLVEGVNANVLAIQVQNMEYEEIGGDPVVNGSFELDDLGDQITCHDEVGIGWTVAGTWVGVDAECGKPGVCTEDCRDPVAPDGNCYAFMQSNDTYLYQVTTHSIVEGKEYTLYFDASLPWNASTDIVASIYYVDDGNEFEIDSNTVSLPSYGGWSYDESVSFTAGSGQAYLGKKLGVKFYAPNLGDSDKWIFIDDVRLQASPPFVPVLDPDCFIDVSLVADTLDPCTTPPNYLTRPGTYEIEALWESDEITPFQSDINIPASVVRPNRTYRVRCRHKDTTGRWSHWSDPNQFLTGDPLSAGIVADLRITELMYNPPDGNGYNNDDFEFIELKNIGSTTLDLTYVSFSDGVTFDFNDSNVTSLAPGAFALVVSNQAAFESRYAGLTSKIAGEYIGNLANDGETVELVDFWNGTIAEFGYNDGRGWPLAADGAGHSMVPLDSAIPGEPFNSLEYGGNWRMSTYMHGSPGADDPTVATTVVLNEIMAHTDYNSPPYDSNDWIELYNTTGSTVNLTSDWYLSDEGNTIANLKKWAIPSTSIGAYGKVSFDEVNDFHNPYPAGFGIDKSGEQMYLSYLPGNSNDRIVDCIRFKGQENNVSFGRYPNGDQFWFHMPTSRGSDNSMPNQCAVVINEIMYHPVDPNDEYIELYNPTGATVNLWNTEGTWRVRGIGNNDYYFPPSTSISSHDSIILVGFDPTVTVDRQAFENAYDTGTLVPNVDIFGPWDGDLSNASERFALEKPQAADPPDVDISWVIVDEVMYGDYSPWPETPDGEGDALHRISNAADESGNDPANWQEGSPSPGS